MHKPPNTNQEKLELIHELVHDQVLFDKIMKRFLQPEGHPRYGWALSYVIEQKPYFANKWLDQMISLLETTRDVANKRNLLRSLQFCQVNEDLVPELLDICYQILSSSSEKIASRVFAMSVIYNQVIRYPELGNELESVLKDLLPFGSAGFRSRATRILWELDKKKRRPH